VRRLTLRKDVLSELSDDALAAVAGASPVTNTCVSVRCTGVMCLYTDAVCTA
jgi:hypothetical protein